MMDWQIGAASRDRVEAMALQLAYQRLVVLGWKFNMSDVGKSAREIIDALDATPGSKEKS